MQADILKSAKQSKRDQQATWLVFCFLKFFNLKLLDCICWTQQRISIKSFFKFYANLSKNKKRRTWHNFFVVLRNFWLQIFAFWQRANYNAIWNLGMLIAVLNSLIFEVKSQVKCFPMAPRRKQLPSPLGEFRLIL